jgi:hypothetical protein
MERDGYPNAYNPNAPKNDARKKEGFYWTAGTIDQNLALYDGGGICNYQGGLTFMNPATMTGARLNDNTARDFGGGVYNVGLYIMMNGTISNNNGPFGAGVFADGGNFIMENGDITTNTATQFGGGVMLYDGQFTMHGGFIRENDGTYYGGGVALMPSANAFAMSGGVISRNRASNGGGTLYFYNSLDPKEHGFAYYGVRPEYLNYNPDGTPASTTFFDTDTNTLVTYPPQRTVPGDPIVNAFGALDSQNRFMFQSLLADYAADGSGVLQPQDRDSYQASNAPRLEVIDGVFWLGTGNNRGVAQDWTNKPGIIHGELNYR